MAQGLTEETGEVTPAHVGEEEQYPEVEDETGCYDPPRWLEENEEEGQLDEAELHEFLGSPV